MLNLLQDMANYNFKSLVLVSLFSSTLLCGNVFGATRINSVFGSKNTEQTQADSSSSGFRSMSVFASPRTRTVASNETDESSVSQKSSYIKNESSPKKRSFFASNSSTSKTKSKEKVIVPRTTELFTGGAFIWPVGGDGGTLSSGYGWRTKTRFHDGLDITGPSGTDILAAASGRVIYATSKIRGYGKMVVVKHNNNMYTVYAHNKTIKVEVGDKVKQGEVIALMGHTGRASGDHLHFEIRKGKFSVNPLKYIGPKGIAYTGTNSRQVDSSFVR